MDGEKLSKAATVCEEGGLKKSSQLMKDLAGGSTTAFLVLERSIDYDDSIFELCSGFGRPANLHLTKESAQKSLELENARILRQQHPFAFGYGHEDVLNVTVDQFEESVSAILGKTFKVPDEDGYRLLAPMVPKKTSDENLLEISKMIRLEFFEIVEVKLNG